MKRNKDTFRNSELDRVRKPVGWFKSIFKGSTKRHHSETGQVEDRTSSVTVVRIIVGLLMVHLIVIGGVLLRGKMVKDGAVSISPPPSSTESQAQAHPATTPPRQAQQQQHQKLSIVAATPQAPTTPQQARVTPAVAPTHITQAPEVEETAEEPEDEPVVVEAVTSTPQEAPVEPLRHKVAPGDTIYRIAHQYNTTEAALRAANPTTLGQGMLRAGTTLEIPTAGQSTPVVQQPVPTPVRPTPATPQQAAPATPQQAAPTTPKVYMVKRGDTLSGIARKTKVSVPELIRLNGLKDANRIHPGMQLRLSK